MSIVLRSRRGAIGTTWWAVALRGALEGLLGVNRAGGGKADARAGRVQWIDVDAGTVRGAVQGIGGESGALHEARLDLPVLSPADRAVVQQVAHGLPGLPARFAAGEYPEQVERELARSEVSLLPRGPSELTHDCTCLDWPGPCRHVAALSYVLVEAVEKDPTLLLTVRGLTLEDLVRPREAETGSTQPTQPPAELSAPDGPSRTDRDGGDAAAAEDGAGRPVAAPVLDPARLDPAPLAAVAGDDVAALILGFFRSGGPEPPVPDSALPPAASPPDPD